VKHWWDRGPLLGTVAWSGVFLLWVTVVMVAMLVLYGALLVTGLY